MTAYDAPIAYDATIGYDGDSMPIFGVDYSFSRDQIDVAAMARDGVKFACRYLRDGTTAGKALLPTEAARLAAAGISIVANDETNGTQLMGGRSGGIRDAASAMTATQACGMPDDRPIYFTPWDHDPAGMTPGQWSLLRGYADGVISVLGLARVGWYGGTRMLTTLRSEGRGSWWWQSLGWREGVWLPWVHIQQYDNGNQRWNGEVDYDRALVPDYGQWGATLSAIGPASWDDADWKTLDDKRLIRLCQWIAGKTNTIYNTTSVGVAAPAGANDIAMMFQALSDKLDAGLEVGLTPEQVQELKTGLQALEGSALIQLAVTPAVTP